MLTEQAVHVKEEILKLGLEITDAQAEQFVTYYEMLVETNKVMNLTAITEFEDVLCKHFVDSLSIVRKMNLKNNIELREAILRTNQQLSKRKRGDLSTCGGI